MTSPIEKSESRRRALVSDRLRFVRTIMELKPIIFDPKQARETPEGGWTHQWLYFDALQNYLLLTCFDLLGQPAEWMDFGNWMGFQNPGGEFDSAIAATNSELDLKKRFLAIYSIYSDTYGVKNSFKRYVSTVLSEEVRQDLLFNIRINQIDPSDNRVMKALEDEKSKIDFLFWIRNSYTHSALNSGSPAGGVIQNFYEPVVVNGKPMKGYVRIALRPIKNKVYEIEVRDWPFALIRAVEAGLTAPS